MAEVEKSTTIDAPLEAVWQRLADFGAISGWAANVDHSCLMSDQTEGVGTTRRIQVGRNTVIERVTTWEPAQRLAYEIVGLPPVVRSVTNTWELTADAEGTHVALTSTIDTGPRPPQQLVARAIGRRLGQASEQMLDGLAATFTNQEANR